MKIYLYTKEMTLDDGNHIIIMEAQDKKFATCDMEVTIEQDHNILKNKKDNICKTRESNTWNSFPLWEIINGEIVSFDYTKYKYFADTDRRNILGKKVGHLYNISSELKIMRKTLKKILDHLEIEDEGFEKFNEKVEKLIEKNPKE